MAYNVKRLGEGREIELGLLTFVPMLNKDIKFSLCSSALLLPSRCCAFALVNLLECFVIPNIFVAFVVSKKAKAYIKSQVLDDLRSDL